MTGLLWFSSQITGSSAISPEEWDQIFDPCRNKQCRGCIEDGVGGNG